MTKGIEHMLGLPSLEDVIQPPPVLDENDHDADAGLDDAVAVMRKTDAALKLLDGKDHAEAMDVLHDENLKTAKDLVDLGYNVDPRSARGIFEVASTFYKNAIDAKNSKRDAQLKTMRLIVDQQRLALEEMKAKAEIGQGGAEIPGSAVVITDSRNEIVKRMRAMRDAEKSEK